MCDSAESYLFKLGEGNSDAAADGDQLPRWPSPTCRTTTPQAGKPVRPSPAARPGAASNQLVSRPAPSAPSSPGPGPLPLIPGIGIHQGFPCPGHTHPALALPALHAAHAQPNRTHAHFNAARLTVLRSQLHRPYFPWHRGQARPTWETKPLKCTVWENLVLVGKRPLWKCFPLSPPRPQHHRCHMMRPSVTSPKNTFEGGTCSPSSPMMRDPTRSPPRPAPQQQHLSRHGEPNPVLSSRSQQPSCTRAFPDHAPRSRARQPW